ncbi:MAG: 16S rRNA (adenine(1518)-N(6)/adenine(1519)-N(6))-dimethyltransferase RsmA [Kiritimatiellia bacterium]
MELHQHYRQNPVTGIPESGGSMNLTSPSQVKAWCIEHEFHPNKVLGQNFLIDRNAREAIVNAGLEGVEPGARVLEIGPGMGVLTEEMLRRGCAVVAVEKDPVLAGRLAESLGNPARLTVIAGDALEVLKPPHLRRTDAPAANCAVDGPFACMVSNLPYQAGTRILLDLVQARQLPAMTVLVQTEVAERLAAKEGSKTRGLAGVWVQLDYDVKIVRKVAASCFWPRPAIGSTIVRLIRHERNLGLSGEERDLFHRLTKKAFEHRRKQLGSIFKDLIQSNARAEELANEDWITLVKGLLTHEDA